jgi:hypothetical protein
LNEIRNRIKAASPELSGRLAFDGNEDAAPFGESGESGPVEVLAGVTR